MNSSPSGFWSFVLRWWYRFLILIDPLVRPRYQAYGIGITVELVVPGRVTGRPRSVLLGLLRVGDRMYLGHPNGDMAWTRNFEAAGRGELRIRGLPPLDVRPIRLPPGPERDAVLRVTWRQQPFPGNLFYFLARAHIRAVGTYFRIEPATS